MMTSPQCANGTFESFLSTCTILILWGSDIYFYVAVKIVVQVHIGAFYDATTARKYSQRPVYQ